MKRLIVNADDLGYDPEIDRGILEAHARGIVTSTTAMVETPFAADALRRAPPTLGVGLHLVVDPGVDRVTAEAVVRRQLARFEALRGAAPTHLDSHKHAHAAPAVLEAVLAVAVERGLAVRSVDGPMRAAIRARGVPTPAALLGDAARRPAWTEEALLEALTALPEGTAELMAHPGHAPSHARTSFGVEREIELAALCGDRARALIRSREIQLCDYTALRRGSRGGADR
ncbi:carbohydrate deacetylase [Anaeromyxobacter oryzisoli]|uniref:carbohydrate deacetylase n=1 Tax=Anaeromyxobacter oryzisoli TaxID=2925408 RepID=UPI001F58EAE8|nr:ChbG/HpnK family deacetylase [Anaeromyxobacter sp. SG63]